MEGNIITVVKTKESSLEFDLTLQGLDQSKDIVVKLVVEANELELGFNCVKKEGDTWTTTMPELTMLDKTAYPFKICVVVDGYYFEPFRGTLNVVGTQEIYATKPKNMTFTPKDSKEPEITATAEEKKDEKEKKEVEESTKRGRERPISQIAKELLENRGRFNPLPKVEKKNPSNKDKLVEQALNDLNIKVTTPKKRTKFSFTG